MTVAIEGSGTLAQLVGRVVRSNLRRDPARARALAGPRGVVALGSGVALRFSHGTLVVTDGAKDPDVEIAGGLDSLVALAAYPRLGPLPHPRAGWRLLRRWLRGEVRMGVRGLRLLGRLRTLVTTDP